ncbi:MAG: hypothetical protein ACXV5H_12055 [Halobacteriota archaeon]
MQEAVTSMRALLSIWIGIAAIWTGIYAATLYLTGIPTSILYIPGFITPVLALFAFWFIPAVYGGYVLASAICDKMEWS